MKRIETSYGDLDALFDQDELQSLIDQLTYSAAYMADIEFETGSRPRGIIIAPDFDAKLVSGARMIEGLTLIEYKFAFQFSNVSAG